ncbi:MAG: putative Ig domain-containing protein [Bacteroidota bacterium]
MFRPYAYNTQMEASMKYNEIFQLTFPQDVFKDVDQEQLTFKLSLKDGSEIPQWMSFDSEKLRLSGKWNTKGAIHLKLTATDVYQNSAEFSFELSEKSH